ncbi:MAG: DUF5050 domain-containing protein [Firmicutes bacterium]|nr:DUF5050 domain-containing protein [Bacillota bacterium]
MKRLLMLICAALTLGISAYAADETEIYIDGTLLECPSAPVNADGRVLVPMRAIFEALGAEVSWDAQGRTVWAARGDEFIGLGIDNDVMSVGVHNSFGEAVWVDSVTLDVPAQIINDYTYIPIRAVSETLGARVSWDAANNAVIIDSRSDISGTVYYASDSDYQRLYSVGINGKNRKKLSDRSVYGLEMYGGSVYYLSADESFLYRADNESGEECVIAAAVNTLGTDADGWLYYQELDGAARESGAVFRLNLDSGETERLTAASVRYPLLYGDYIYFNIDGSNNMFAVTTDGAASYEISIGDTSTVKLYTFNCRFFGGYILVENGVWYGSIVRMNLDGSGVVTLNQTNFVIFENQTQYDKIFYLNPSDGQDIYCINIDGTDEHLVVKGDSSWIDIDVVAQWGNMIYYKNPMRSEVYRVNADGSENEYVCYADTVKVVDGRLFSSYQGLYTGSLDAHDMVNIYAGGVKDFEVIGDTVYLTAENSSRLFTADFYGNSSAVTMDSVGEWVCDIE